MTSRTRLRVRDLRFLENEFAAAALEFSHPPRHLDPLINSLRVGIQTRCPIDHLRTVRPRNAEADSLDSGAFLLPEIQVEVAFRLQRRIEHALARHHSPRANLLSGAVREQRNFVTFVQQSQRKLQPGLPSANNGDALHSVKLPVSPTPSASESLVSPFPAPSPNSPRPLQDPFR